MPELPEVETVRRGLIPTLQGARLKSVRLNRADLRIPFPEGFVQRLTGAVIEKIERRAKYLLAWLDRDDVLVMHLGMSGRFEVEGRRPGDFHHKIATDAKHAHVVFETEAGDVVTFYDPRRFGFMDLVPADKLAEQPWFARMGPEPLSEGFDAEHLAQAFAGRKQGPKTLLLDQHVVAGIGNIYACEALNRARISPFKPALGISRSRLDKLVHALKAVLTEAIEAGGSSLRDHARPDGELGYFQHHFRVYDREGEPCPNRGCPGVVERQVQAGRSTFYCPVCQV